MDKVYAKIILDSAQIPQCRHIVAHRHILNENPDKYKKEVVTEFNFEIDIDTTEEEQNKIIKRKTIDIKPMDEEEAILQMELLGHEFFMYKDADTGKAAVVYKRKDKDYGLLSEE